MNPGLVPRELSGTQLLSEDMGTGWRGVKFEVPKAFYQVCLALCFWPMTSQASVTMSTKWEQQIIVK